MSTLANSGTGPGSNRSRFSLILQLSSRKPRDVDTGSQVPLSTPTSPLSSSRPFYFANSTSLASLCIPSPRSPTSSTHMNAHEALSTEHIPPTVNELGAAQKAMLLKKARKLSKVFGEIPSSVSALPPTSGPPPMTLHHRRSASLASTVSSRSPPSSRRPSQVDSDRTEVIPTSLPQIIESRHSRIQSFDSDTPPLPATAGATPHKQSTKSSNSSTRITLTTYHSTPTLPIPQGSDLRSRRSLDGIDPATAIASDDRTRPSPRSNRIKRSRSAVPQKGPRDAPSQDTLDFRARYNDMFGADSEMSRRRKALNVQRARKMAKVFGEDPPSNLITISDEARVSIDHGGHGLYSVVPHVPQADDRHVRQPILDAEHSTFSSDFRDRRRRAEKLSRFFGVAYQSIDYVPPPPVSKPSPVISPFPPSSPEGSVQIDVKMTGRRFWAFDAERERTKEADITDVMDRLRLLKAA